MFGLWKIMPRPTQGLETTLFPPTRNTSSPRDWRSSKRRASSAVLQCKGTRAHLHVGNWHDHNQTHALVSASPYA
ncbi:hypothetical protein SETIT_6G158600v2 [Setaria italica]|uniref:Uncharacterized protein n=1 Tax=Setaria italica TaxID=4555 RepID=A0A368RM16_SETIT|nr:hypothetical protein SETIT_6G158600v2 [Setaria italica]